MLLQHCAILLLSSSLIAAALPVMSHKLFGQLQEGVVSREVRRFVASRCWCSLARALLPELAAKIVAKRIDDTFGVLRAEASVADRVLAADGRRIAVYSSIALYAFAAVAAVCGVGVVAFSDVRALDVVLRALLITGVFVVVNACLFGLLVTSYHVNFASLNRVIASELDTSLE